MADGYSDQSSTYGSVAGQDSSSTGNRTPKSGGGYKGALRAAGATLSSAGQTTLDRSAADSESRVGPVQYRRGGKVRRTGTAVVHKGERVIPKSKVRKVEKMMKRSKMRMKAGR